MAPLNHKSRWESIKFSMNKVKWLWCITAGVGLVLLYAAPSAYFVDTDGIYATLKLPSFILPSVWITVAWSIVYAADMAVISRLVYHKKSVYLTAAVVVTGILNTVWCVAFFRFGALRLCFALSVFMTALVLAIAVFLVREESCSLIFWQLKIVWYGYLVVAAYYVCLLNG